MMNLVIYSVKYHRCFQPHNGPGHTADKSVASRMRCMRQYRQVCRFPAGSYCTFYDGGKMEGKVYRKNPNATETLQSNL